MNPFGGDARGYGAGSALAKLAAALVALAALAGAGGGRGADPRARRLADRRLRAARRRGLRAAARGLAGGARRGGRRRSSTAASRATPRAGGLARIGWALGDDIDAVIVALGANDMLRGIDPGVTEANLDGILTAIDAQRPAGDRRRAAGAAELSRGLPRGLQGDVPRPRRRSTTRSTTRSFLGGHGRGAQHPRRSCG